MGDDAEPQDTPGPEELPDALADALGMETARRQHFKELHLSGGEDLPEPEKLPTFEEEWDAYFESLLPPEIKRPEPPPVDWDMEEPY